MATPAETLALAAQYLETGNILLAEQYATSILSEEPSHAGAMHLLGLIAQQKGKLDEAIVFLNRSLTADGANAMVWQHAGDVLLASGDVRGGITYYEQVLRLRPDFADGYNTLGSAWQRLGDWPRAERCFQESTRLAPSLAPAFNNLGATLRSQKKWAAATAAFEQALKLWPDSPDVAYNLGNTHHDQGDLDRAEACYRQALRLKPSYAAEVSNSLACALREQGRWEEAGAQFQETLTLRPDHAMALYNLSEFSTAGRHLFPPAAVDRIKSIRASGRGSEEEQSLFAFALANVLHLQGAYDEAFGHYRQAKDLQKRLFKKRNAAFDARAHQALIDKIIADHGRSYFERVKKWGTNTELPVLLIGMPCSGSALVEQVLARHPKIFGAGESGNVYRFMCQVAAARDPAASLSQLFPNLRAARQAGAELLQHIAQMGNGAARVTLRNMENLLALGVIATLFHGARVIFCRRDPLDTCLACYFRNLKDMAFACALEDIGAYHLAFEKLMAHWCRVLPLKVHEVNYEDLLQNQEKAHRALLSFCGLEWDERSATRARQPLASEEIGLSRHYRSHLGPLLKALGRSHEE
ncbi:MAG TPA: tetratricopeptide repeat protein [Gemmataceae bacterium]|jgi:tetratricopeptide (TPR) repeat protein|nr:tetratricopeptide repeat protein [Gemmataceae bacterium]